MMIIEAVGGADTVKDLGVFVIVKVARGGRLSQCCWWLRQVWQQLLRVGVGSWRCHLGDSLSTFVCLYFWRMWWQLAHCQKKKIEAWQYLHGMIEMFTYLNLPILFGIILLCRIINIARCMYLVVYCSPEMKCLVTSYVKTKYNNFANINLFKAPECEWQRYWMKCHVW